MKAEQKLKSYEFSYTLFSFSIVIRHVTGVASYTGSGLPSGAQVLIFMVKMLLFIVIHHYLQVCKLSFYFEF